MADGNVVQFERDPPASESPLGDLGDMSIGIVPANKTSSATRLIAIICLSAAAGVLTAAIVRMVEALPPVLAR